MDYSRYQCLQVTRQDRILTVAPQRPDVEVSPWCVVVPSLAVHGAGWRVRRRGAVGHHGGAAPGRPGGTGHRAPVRLEGQEERATRGRT